jgi:hypothetical protein
MPGRSGRPGAQAGWLVVVSLPTWPATYSRHRNISLQGRMPDPENLVENDAAARRTQNRLAVRMRSSPPDEFSGRSSTSPIAIQSCGFPDTRIM